ncbi:MAG: hypothetical protein ACPGJV_02440 [Bacteriovoracaceae bacterium]
MKKAALSVILAIPFAIIVFFYDNLLAPTKLYPLTYSVNKKSLTPPDNIESSSILFIGDRVAVHHSSFIDDIMSKLQSDQIENLKISNWASAGDGLHRTVAKIQSLNETPKVIIYSGGSEEFFEKRLSLVDRNAINTNISRYENDMIFSLILSFPSLSKFIYKPTKNFLLGKEPNQDKSEFSALGAQSKIEIVFKFFEIELKRLAEKTRKSNSFLFLITTPIKRDLPPSETCENANTQTIENFQNKLSHQLKLGKAKQALPKLEELVKKTVANAKSHYLLANAYKQLGFLNESKKQFELANAYDCNPIRGHVAFNQMLRKVAKKYDHIVLIDFDHKLNHKFGKDTLFKSDLFPHDFYYYQINQQIVKAIKQSLKI